MGEYFSILHSSTHEGVLSLVMMISPDVIDSDTKVVPLGTKGEAEGEKDLTAGQHVQKRFQETYTQ